MRNPQPPGNWFQPPGDCPACCLPCARSVFLSNRQGGINPAIWGVEISMRESFSTKNYTTVDPKQLHKSHMKFWRQTQNTDTASQPTWEASWETRPETREKQNQGGGHGIPANVGDKTGNKRKQRPGRRTQHPSQGKHT